jgi:hypothetical protein
VGGLETGGALQPSAVVFLANFGRTAGVARRVPDRPAPIPGAQCEVVLMRKLKIPNIPTAIRAFHEDEEGLEALQVVMIIAIAAAILIAVMKLWPHVQEWFSKETDQILKFKQGDFKKS